MPPDNQQYDYTQDQQFLSAPAQQQHAYLLANDSDYAKADPKTQGAYISHLRGYDKPTQFEQQNTPPKVEGSTGARIAYGVGRGIADVAGGTWNMLRHPIDTAVETYEDSKNHIQQGQKEPTTLGKAAEYGAAVPFLGPFAKSLGERYGAGDRAGAIAEGLTAVAGPSVLKEAAVGAGRAALPARDAIARGFREGPRVVDPATQTISKGPLRPWVKAAVGPIDLVGGEKMANAIIPAHPDVIDPRLSAGERTARLKPWGAEAQKAEFMNKGYAPAPNPQEPLAEFMNKGYQPADQAAVAEAIRNGVAGKVPTRMPKPAAPEAVRPGPVGTSTSPESVATLPPAALPEIAKGAQGSMTSTGPVPATPLGTPEVAAKPVDPVAAAIKQGIAAKLPTRMPKVTPAPPSIADISPQANEPRFSGSEGRPATWTNETVNELAAKGNRDAISQAIRRGLQLPNNARYIMGDADYPRAVLNPRETTLFAPDGTPIRNAENPLAQNPSSKARIEMPPAPTSQPSVDFSHPSARPVLDQHAPQLRELATRLHGAEPDIAQHLIDIADGKSVGLEQLEGKIRDPEAARQFSRLLDDARREARIARTAPVDKAVRGAGSQAERTTQAPELKSTPSATSDVRKSIPSKVYTQQEMIDAGADGYLDRATKQDIPLSKITGREPTPAMEGGYQKGRKITQPIEVEKQGDEYILYSGNHRVTQAELNGQETIPAFVKEEPRAAKSALKNTKPQKP